MNDPEFRHCGAPGYDVCPDCAVHRAIKSTKCPLIYQRTDLKRLPAQALELSKHPFGEKGLVLYGASGTCKTRVAWLVVNRWEKEEGKQIACFDCLHLAHEIDRQFGDGEGPEWIDGVCRHDGLFLDDLDKAKQTDRVQMETFGLIERFMADGKPVIITSNSNGSALSQKFSPNIGPALVRRLREFCECKEMK